MRREQAFPTKYLSTKDITKPVIVTIDDVRPETIVGDRADEEKPVMTFREDMKPLVLNSTNWTTVETAYGEESDDWRGHQVELYIDPGIMYAGKRVGGIRIRVAPTANGSKTQTTDVWTWPQAQEKAAEAGIDKDALVDALKQNNRSGWNGARDTQFVRDLIDAQGDDLPF